MPGPDLSAALKTAAHAKKLSSVPRKPRESAPAAPKPLPPPSRRGAVSLTVYVQPDVRTALKIISAQTGHSVQALVWRGIDAVFAEHGRPEIASSR